MRLGILFSFAGTAVGEPTRREADSPLRRRFWRRCAPDPSWVAGVAVAEQRRHRDESVNRLQTVFRLRNSWRWHNAPAVRAWGPTCKMLGDVGSQAAKHRWRSWNPPLRIVIPKRGTSGFAHTVWWPGRAGGLALRGHLRPRLFDGRPNTQTWVWGAFVFPPGNGGVSSAGSRRLSGECPVHPLGWPEVPCSAER